MIDEFIAQHEQLGPAVARLITEYAASVESRPVASEATPADIYAMFDEEFPEVGTSIDELMERFRTQIARHAMTISSPRYFGQFNPAPLPIGVWSDALCSTLNQNAGAWRNGPTSAIIEARVIRWLCELLGYGPQSYGTLASGGSEANLLGLKLARDSVSQEIIRNGLRSVAASLVIYASEQCHYSIEKSADILGIGRDMVRKIPTDEHFHIRLDALEEAIANDRAAGLTTCCVVGVAGATSTGVFDPLDELADIAQKNKCWYHVDAAYGGSVAFSAQHRDKLRGLERADSITFDPHKWMFVPFACGATLVRDGGRVLRDSFDSSPEYLAEDRGGSDVEFDFFRYGQLGSRRFNSLKLWMALKSMGRQGYAKVVERQIGLTQYLAERLDGLEDFQRVSPVETAVCCFKYLPASVLNSTPEVQDRLQQDLQQHIERSGKAWLTTTVLHGRRTFRVNINSFLTEQRHVDDLLELLQLSGREVSAA
jgi:aromatic-L-amino-acid decarboxylase